MSPPTIYFVRHGQTDWNAEARLQGQLDIPLNDIGRVQAEEAGRRLRRQMACDQLDFVASPLGRARETMERIRASLGLPPEGYRQDARLKELTFGAWEGATWKELRAREREGVRAREADLWGFAPPGGESYAMLEDRVRPVLAELDRDSLVVSHGGVARAFLVLLCKVAREDAPRLDIWQGRVLVMREGGYRWA